MKEKPKKTIKKTEAIKPVLAPAKKVRIFEGSTASKKKGGHCELDNGYGWDYCRKLMCAKIP